MDKKRVVIVGGGIAGLAAAYRLQQTAPDAAITLVESEQRLGGKIVTERVAGFVIEGGPDSFLSYKPRGLGLCRELGLEDRLHGTNEKVHRTYVMRGQKLYPLPEGLSGLIPSRFGPMLKTGLISPIGKLRMGLDYVIPSRSGNGDETLAAFVQRRLGRELYDRLIEPLLSGIYAGDGAELSLGATFPQLRQAELDHGSLIRGMLAAKQKSPSANGHRQWPAFLTPATGLVEIVEALEAKLTGVELRVGARAARVAAAGDRFRVLLEPGDSIVADAVILATPAFVAADLISNLDSQLADTLRSIPYVSTATVSVAYPLAHIPRPLDGYGYLVPRAEGRAILACTWTSTKFPHRAPKGYGLIRAFVGRAGQEEALDGSDDDLLNLVREELRTVLGITAPPMLQRVFRWPKAMPQYTLGHLDRLTVIDRRLAAHPGLVLAGNAYRGVGIPDCIASGEAAAEQVSEFLSKDSEQ
ncbi:MAG TPA: protoporphyrinogen oxidase [Anaerolineae bacterium]|nr:protoporphyrinogen oxidase [Anaerolineae bacterium]